MLTQLCLTLCDPMACSLPSFSVQPGTLVSPAWQADSFLFLYLKIYFYCLYSQLFQIHILVGYYCSITFSVLIQRYWIYTFIGSQRLPWWLRCKESACNTGDLGSIPGSRKSPEEGNGYPLHYSCLENSMNRGRQADSLPIAPYGKTLLISMHVYIYIYKSTLLILVFFFYIGTYFLSPVKDYFYVFKLLLIYVFLIFFFSFCLMHFDNSIIWCLKVQNCRSSL